MMMSFLPSALTRTVLADYFRGTVIEQEIINSFVILHKDVHNNYNTYLGVKTLSH